MRSKLLTALGVLGLSMWFDITAIALPYWWRVKNTNLRADIGLFRYCTTLPKVACISTVSDENTRWMQAIQALLIVAVIAICTSITIIVLHIYLKMNSKKVIYIAAGLTVLAGILSSSALIVFASHISNTFPGGHYLIGFGLTIISIILSFSSFGSRHFFIVGIIYMSSKTD